MAICFDNKNRVNQLVLVMRPQSFAKKDCSLLYHDRYQLKHFLIIQPAHKNAQYHSA